MSRAELTNVGINYREAGLAVGNDTAMLVHGLNTNMAFWHPLLVRQLGAVRHLVIYDHRGHGYSDMPRSGYTTADLALDAVRLLDALEVENVDIVAHSFGAAVSLQIARLYPDRVRSLVVLDGRVRLLQPELRLRDWSQFERWQRHFAEAGIELDPGLELDFEMPLHIDGAMWAKAQEGLATEGFFVPGSGKRALAKYRKLLTETTAAKDFRELAGLTHESLRRITIPIIAVYGSISPYLPTAQGLQNEIPNCQFELIPGGGHNFPFLQPEQTLKVIEQFWSTCWSGSLAS